MENFWLVCYDIACPKRLRRVERICEDFGFRAQDSVFACAVTPEQLITLENRLKRVMLVSEDSLRCYPLCERDQNSVSSVGHDLLASVSSAAWIV
jgi:CRISPR-associated protein Cas2